MGFDKQGAPKTPEHSTVAKTTTFLCVLVILIMAPALAMLFSDGWAWYMRVYGFLAGVVLPVTVMVYIGQTSIAARAAYKVGKQGVLKGDEDAFWAGDQTNGR